VVAPVVVLLVVALVKELVPVLVPVRQNVKHVLHPVLSLASPRLKILAEPVLMFVLEVVCIIVRVNVWISVQGRQQVVLGAANLVPIIVQRVALLNAKMIAIRNAKVHAGIIVQEHQVK